MLVSLFLFSPWIVVVSAVASDEKLLIDHIRQQLQETDSVLRPVRNSSQPLELSTLIFLNNLLELDERSQIVVLKISMYSTWKNEYISWNSSDFGGRTLTYLPKSELWYPKIDTYTRVENLNNGGDSNYADMWVHSDGTCGFLSNHILTLFCKVDMRRYPFDKHTCSFTMSSWIYTPDELVHTVTASDDAHEPNSEFEVESFSATPKMLPGIGWTYPVINLQIKFSRQPQFLINMMFLPMAILMMMSGAAFFLPPNLESKANIQLSVILSLAVYSLLLSDQMPPSQELPVAGELLITIMSLNLFALTFSIFTINLSSNNKYAPPHWLLNACKALRFLCCCHDGVCCKPAKNAVDQETIKVKQFMDKEKNAELADLQILTDFVKRFEESELISEKWMLVATVLDRTYFLLMAISVAAVFGSFVSPIDE